MALACPPKPTPARKTSTASPGHGRATDEWRLVWCVISESSTQTAIIETNVTTVFHQVENGNLTCQLNQTTQTMMAGPG